MKAVDCLLPSLWIAVTILSEVKQVNSQVFPMKVIVKRQTLKQNHPPLQSRMRLRLTLKEY
jgi:hypothetical protein